jgi:hypothetical protein
MFKKICFSPSYEDIDTHPVSEVLASPKIIERFNKLAGGIKSVAPKSDDFLYFSIIFLKAAESALLDQGGKTKKVAGEDAWGFFDENWKWHGNVKPHRNNNLDIFPESQLKIATPMWVGKPLCRDHESSSVDGIRGIILDTYYDEKFKQVVGLCALDRVNYPDLARKVESGMVRYGSMGTAVETSVCTECGNKASTQDEYCNHITSRAAHGEINIGLKPIEYSLVVQPAEPGAILLKCIASLNEYKQEFSNYGVPNVPEMLGSLSEKQAQHLDSIMKTACGDDGCSIKDRRSIVTSFLSNNGLVKSADSTELRNIAESAKALSDPNISPDVKTVIEDKILQNNAPEGESFTSPELVDENIMPGNVNPFYATSRMGLTGSGDTGSSPDFETDGDLLSFNPSGEAAVAVTASGHDDTYSEFLTRNGVSDIDDLTISSILEDIMNESRLKKRAELRRRIAYMQGGAEGREPNTYKSEDFSKEQDKQMQQTGSMGGDTGMHPGDAETKEKLSRAELNERRLKRMAYMQGGAEGREPNTYKSEDFSREQDKQMQQTGSMGGDTGMHPGDAETKEKLSRAERGDHGLTKSAYSGPSLRTRFLAKTTNGGSVDRESSVFQVFAGDKRVISATASEIFGPELNSNWDWLTSREYGKEVCKQIRLSGLNHVAKLLKSAQDMELPPLPVGGDEAPEAPMGDMPPSMDDMPPMEDMTPEADETEALGEEVEEANPAVEIDNRLANMETLINEVRDLVDEMQDQKMADVDVNVFTGKGDAGDVDQVETGMTALSRKVLTSLKECFAKLDNSADELSMVAETYDNISKLSSAQASDFKKLASAAVRDADQITGQAVAAVKFASAMKADLTADTTTVTEEASFSEDNATDSGAPGEVEGLMASAMTLRRNRREAILKQANSRLLKARADSREALARKASEQEVSEAAYADDTAAGALEEMSSADDADADGGSDLKEALAQRVSEKKADEARETYRVKLRRAYDVGMDMQRKGLLPVSKASLDTQVDEIMEFDDRAFESFKRSIANAKPVRQVKVASDLGGINIGVKTEDAPVRGPMSANALSHLWD